MTIDYTKIKRITRPEFLRIDEDNIMFIRRLGRMADSDMVFFIIKEDDEFICYNIDGLTHDNGVNKYEYISRDDIYYKLPNWTAAHDMTLPIITIRDVYGITTPKYVCMFFGYGDTLCINNSIYEKYEKYLKREIEEFSEKYPDKSNFKTASIIEWQWFEVLLNFLKDQKKELINYNE